MKKFIAGSLLAISMTIGAFAASSAPRALSDQELNGISGGAVAICCLASSCSAIPGGIYCDTCWFCNVAM